MSTNTEPLEQEPREAKLDLVTTYEMTQLWNTLFFSPNGQRWNPDDLVGKKGLRIYAQMQNDEQVKAVCEFKLGAILARGWEFKYPDGSSQLGEEQQQERIRVFNCAVSHMRGSFTDALEAIATGRENGFSVTEKVYSNFSDNGKTYIGINKLLTRDPCTFEFFTDDYGDLTKVQQRVSGKDPVVLDRASLIFYVHKPKWDRIYGRSDLRAAYRSWYAKDQLIKLQLLYLEKFAGGFFVARRTSDSAPAFGSREYASLQSALSNIGSLRSLILPLGIEGEATFPPDSKSFGEAIEYHDLGIAKALLVPNLLGISHTGQTGAYSQSQTQLEAFFWTLQGDSARLMDCLNEELFRDLGDQNWGDGDYPQFTFKPASMEHIKWIIDTWQKLITSGAVVSTEKDENHLREILEMSPREKEDKPLIDPVQQTQLDQSQQSIDQKGQQLEQQAKSTADTYAAAIRKELEEVKASLNALLARAEPAAPNINVRVEQPQQPALAASANGAAIHVHGPVIFSMDTIERAAKRVNFSVIDKSAENLTTKTRAEIAAQVAKATKRALGTDEAMRMLLDSDTADVAALQFNQVDVGRMKKTYRDALDESWSSGTHEARRELASAGRKQMVPEVRAAALRDKAASFFDTNAFRMAGDTSDNARKIIQQELQNGIKGEKTIADVRTAIWDRLVARGLTSAEAVRGVETDDAVNGALDELWVDTEEQAASYLDTLVRTNTFEALNAARMNEFTDESNADFVLALQYAAVLDDRTTDLCESLDGSIYAADSDIWDKYTPPNHFNCRSILIPITTLDDWNGRQSDDPSLAPAKGFA